MPIQLQKWICLVVFGGLIGCKDPGVKNIQKDSNGQFITMDCPPYGILPFRVDDGEQLGEDWDSDKSKCLNLIQDNWVVLWPIVESKFDEMATRYAYGEQKLELHLKNSKNTLYIRPADKEHWSISLSIIKERPGLKRRPGSHAFCIDMERDKVLEYQPVY